VTRFPWLAIAALVVAGATAGPAEATTFVAMTEPPSRVRRRRRGRHVTELETVGDVSGGIYTLVTVHVEATHKGDVGREIVLKQPGGELAERGLVIPGRRRSRAVSVTCSSFRRARRHGTDDRARLGTVPSSHREATARSSPSGRSPSRCWGARAFAA
jgi:hypothetical protein